MVNFKEELIRIAAAFDAAGIAYAVCGGLAVGIHGFPRSTKDIDIMIRKESLESARRVLEPMGYILEAGMLPFDWGKPTQREIFRTSRAIDGQLLSIDLMLVSPFLEPVWDDREGFNIEGHRISVVSLAGLTLMKRTAGRPQDLIDLNRLSSDDGES